jgi:hypothetical protein
MPAEVNHQFVAEFFLFEQVRWRWTPRYIGRNPRFHPKNSNQASEDVQLRAAVKIATLANAAKPKFVNFGRSLNSSRNKRRNSMDGKRRISSAFLALL